MGAVEAWDYLLLLATVRSDSHEAEIMDEHGERRIRRRLEHDARSAWPWVRMPLCARERYRRAWVLARRLVETPHHDAGQPPAIFGEDFPPVVFVRRHSGRPAAAAGPVPDHATRLGND